MESMHDLEILINAHHRLVVLETEREGCFIEGFRRLASRSSKAYFQWTVTQGLLRLAEGYTTQTMNKDINQLFAQIHSTDQAGVYVLVDFHHYLNDPVAIRHIKEVLMHSSQHCLILLAQKIDLPEELDTLVTHYKLPLPSEQDLSRLVNDLAVEYLSESNQRLRADDKTILQRLIDNLCGLSYRDARRMARHAIFNDGIINQSDIEDITREKFSLLNRNNTLSLELDFADLDEVAGIETLRQWLNVRARVFRREITLPGGDLPKGMLLLGVQGCGKSLAAKAVAGSWGLPLLRLDFGTLYNRFYGQTEENLRTALEAAERMQPCVLWLDEVEKGLSAVSSSDDVSKRLLGTFLTWLAENKSAVFVVATANAVDALPPELLRKGRFDEVFFVDLPNTAVRKEILELHLRKRELSIDDVDLERVAIETNGFSGAELEQLVVSAVYQRAAQIDNEDSITLDTGLLLEMAGETQPLSRLMSEKISGLRQWSEGRAVLVGRE